MKRSHFFSAALLGFLLFSGAISNVAHAEHTRVTNPSVAAVEVLGRTLGYGVAFDQVVSDDVAAGLGIGWTGVKLNGVDANRSATLIPVYVNYYFTRDKSSLLATGGVTLVSDSSSLKGYESEFGNVTFNSSVMPTAGLGFESRGDIGFLFRATAYVVFGKDPKPWVGATFGYAF